MMTTSKTSGIQMNVEKGIRGPSFSSPASKLFFPTNINEENIENIEHWFNSSILEFVALSEEKFLLSISLNFIYYL